MKTAEEWLKEEWGVMEAPGGGYIGYIEHSGGEFINLIKQIQLDAWKQGMTDASKMVDSWHPLDHRDNVDLRDDIIEAAEEKQSL